MYQVIKTSENHRPYSNKSVNAVLLKVGSPRESLASGK